MASPLFRKRLFSSSGSKDENPNDSAIGLAPNTPQHATKPFASASDGALSTVSTSHSLVSKPIVKRRRSGSKKGNRAKASFLSRFVHRVVPCVNSVDTLNRIDIEKSPVPTPTIKEKPGDNASSIDTDLPLTVPPINVYPPSPPSPADSEIIIPPPPTHHLLPEDETDGLTSGAVQPPGSTGHEVVSITTPPTPSTSNTSQIERTRTRESDHSESTNYSDEEDIPDPQQQILLDEQAEEERLIRQGGAGIPIGSDGVPKPLLPPIAPEHIGRKCLVLDLDETLVHSSFKAIPQADFIVPVEIEYHWHHFHVLKRPGVDNFLKRMGELYEVVVFTASLSKYADPVLDKLDIHNVVAHRLFRESCYNHKGNYVKDLSQLGRPLSSTIILDNSPASYIFHPHNAVPVSSWFNDPHDAELTDLIPFLDDLSTMGSSECDGGGWTGDVRGVLDGGLDHHEY